MPSGPLVGPEAINLSQSHDASKNVVGRPKSGKSAEVPAMVDGSAPSTIAADQYLVVPGWNVRQLCQNSCEAKTVLSEPVTPRPFSA